LKWVWNGNCDKYGGGITEAGLFLCSLATRQKLVVPHKIPSINTFQNIALGCRSNGIVFEPSCNSSNMAKLCIACREAKGGEREAETYKENRVVDPFIINLEDTSEEESQMTGQLHLSINGPSINE
jgi:hypothetical protein